MRELAALDGDPVGAVRLQRCWDADGGLGLGVAVRGERPVRIRERQAPDGDIMDELALRRIALEAHELNQRRSDHFRGRHVLAWPRQIVDVPAPPFQVPLAGLVQCVAVFSTQ